MFYNKRLGWCREETHYFHDKSMSQLSLANFINDFMYYLFLSPNNAN